MPDDLELVGSDDDEPSSGGTSAESVTTNRTIIRRESFVGPLPPPQILAEYEKVSPGLAKSIAESARDEQQHRHYCEKRFTPFHFVNVLLGRLITAGTIVAIVYLAISGFQLMSATITVFLGIPSLVKIIKELIEKFSKS